MKSSLSGWVLPLLLATPATATPATATPATATTAAAIRANSPMTTMMIVTPVPLGRDSR
jgi:hypothetical protein